MKNFSPSSPDFVSSGYRMKNMQDQNKWEEIAARLHDEKSVGSSAHEITEEDRNIEKTMSRILDSSKDVRRIRDFQSPEIVWERLKNKLIRRNYFSGFLKYAAVALIAVLSTVTVNYFLQKYASSAGQFASVSSPNGQITNVTLFDGTNVWLNAESTLKYKKTFNQSDREVYLDGEALFNVTKNSKKPFIVNAGDAKVKVHGTVFDVKAYKNMPTLETVLLEGNVEFIRKGKSVFIKPGEELVLSSQTGKIQKSVINTAEYTSWKGGKIYFNNKTLEDLTTQLERWYEVKFRFGSEKLKSYHFSGVINKDRSLDYTLNIIEAINKVEFKRNKDEILITKAK